MLKSEAKPNNIPLTNASPAPVVSIELDLIPATLPRNFCIGHCHMRKNDYIGSSEFELKRSMVKVRDHRKGKDLTNS